jgi:hypothetical protein
MVALQELHRYIGGVVGRIELRPGQPKGEVPHIKVGLMLQSCNPIYMDGLDRKSADQGWPWAKA